MAGGDHAKAGILDSLRASPFFMDQRISMSDTHQITPNASSDMYMDEKNPMPQAYRK
jgi:hypothetical protein